MTLRPPTTLLLAGILLPGSALTWEPLPVDDDPLVRMPGTQPGQVTLVGPDTCVNCHADFGTDTAPVDGWRGSMMAHSARDPLFWAALTVAAQDSIWLLGRPNATDLCLRCHFPKGWLEERSDPTNASAMTDFDYDGVQCTVCHRMFDPFAQATADGTREGSDWAGYWDEATSASQTAAADALGEDLVASHSITRFNGTDFYDDTTNLPASTTYTENGTGQYFIGLGDDRRGPFQDEGAPHGTLYSRYHKSKYFCQTCHDVSNPVLENLDHDGTPPGDGLTILPSEELKAASYGHVERTFSEFLLSDFGVQGGAPGTGAFAPAVFETSRPNDVIASCQDCHMPDRTGQACDTGGAVTRPDDSAEHPKSGVPSHDLTGANVWVSRVLASTVPESPNYDSMNESLLGAGPSLLTLDLTAGLGIDPYLLLAGADRALANLESAASVELLDHDPLAGTLRFRIVNHTGHKLITGYPEGRRMWVGIRLLVDGAEVHEINPYDPTAGTLKGLPDAAGSPPLEPDEEYLDELVYEMRSASSATGESHTFHFVLADSREKDNRIPPPGFRIAEAAERLVRPVVAGVPDPDLFTAEEYAGGYDEVEVSIPTGAETVEISLWYQTTSREYVEFLRHEIEGTADSLSSPTPSGEPSAYIAQTDPFFSKLAAWGQTIWDLWSHNKDVPGAAPILMTRETLLFDDGFESGGLGRWSSSIP